MNTTIQNLISNELIAVLSGITTDGNSYSSLLHYSHLNDPLRFYFQAWNSSEKVHSIKEGDNKSASVIIGLDKPKNVTLQMKGNLRIIDDVDELEAVKKNHYLKHSQFEQHKDKDISIIEFIPSWGRYTDMNTKPDTIIMM
jgi:general stress protein 26